MGKIPEGAFHKNLEVIEKMLEEGIQSERLIKAEITREQCRFEECNRLMNFKFSEYYNDTIEFLKKCNDEKKSVVMDMTDWFNEKRKVPMRFTSREENNISERELIT